MVSVMPAICIELTSDGLPRGLYRTYVLCCIGSPAGLAGAQMG